MKNHLWLLLFLATIGIAGVVWYARKGEEKPAAAAETPPAESAPARDYAPPPSQMNDSGGAPTARGNDVAPPSQPAPRENSNAPPPAQPSPSYDAPAYEPPAYEPPAYEPPPYESPAYDSIPPPPPPPPDGEYGDPMIPPPAENVPYDDSYVPPPPPNGQVPPPPVDEDY